MTSRRLGLLIAFAGIAAVALPGLLVLFFLGWFPEVNRIRVTSEAPTCEHVRVVTGFWRRDLGDLCNGDRKTIRNLDYDYDDAIRVQVLSSNGRGEWECGYVDAQEDHVVRFEIHLSGDPIRPSYRQGDETAFEDCSPAAG